ncbi:glucosamine-6-phosphate isomerase [Lacipirellula parvula]|nr:glucosamine-6-phosphate isomerase [Lacipirellula parvula]
MSTISTPHLKRRRDAVTEASMTRPLSKVAPDWWDYTTLDPAILADAARLNERTLKGLARPGFTIHLYDTLEEFYLAEALEYIDAWRQSSPDNPTGICGPIGPTEQLPLVARIVNSIELNLSKVDAHFWGMDEWVEAGRPVGIAHPLSFARADMELCFNRIDRKLRPRRENIHFPTGDLKAFSDSFDQFHCAVMQGGQGEVKHWAFNDPLPRSGKWKHEPPPATEYRKLGARIVDLHPMTVIQNARTSGGGQVASIPTKACTVGPRETWKCDRVSIWQAGCHDNPFGQRLTALMVSKRLVCTSVPMSLLADHADVHFHYLRSGLGSVESAMH